MKNSIIIIIAIVIWGCANKPKTISVVMNWDCISNTGKSTDFCQVDSSNNGYIFSYSHSFAISGGCKVVNLSDKEGIVKDSILYECENASFSCVLAKDNVLWILQDDFISNTLSTKLIQKFGNDSVWNEVNTPLEGIRKILSLNDVIIIEGNLDGTGRVYTSKDNGLKWNEINVLNLDLKNLYLLSAEKGKALCQGSTSFKEADNKLFLLDIEKQSIKILLDLKDKKYLKPILNSENVFAIIEDDKVNVYSLENERIHLMKEFNCPDESADVLNLFMSDQYYIITGKQKEMFGKTLSWISNDKGENWFPFEQEREFMLIYNDFGQLFMMDKQNNLLIGK